MKFVVFIAETYVQLVATYLRATLLVLSVCSCPRLATDCSSAVVTLTNYLTDSNCHTVLYDAFYSYLCRCYWNGILGPSSLPLPGESFDACSKAVAFTLADTQVFFNWLILLYFQWGSLGPLRMVGKLMFYMLGCDEVILLDGFDFLCNAISMRSTISIL